MWVNEEPLGPRTLEIIKELQERAWDWEAKWKAKLICYAERHKAEMKKVKKKNTATFSRMFVLVSLMMNMVVSIMNEDSVIDIEDYDEFGE